MAKKMTKELYEELNEAGKVLCKYCENNEFKLSSGTSDG